MHRSFGSIILDTSFRVLVPFTLVYGIYVLVHGEYSPGGGFQAGALLAVGVVLARLVQGREPIFNIKGTTALILAGIGTFIYGAIGFSTMIFGGKFLEYGRFPIDLHDPAELHALGMLGIEIGVTICVMATIITIFDALTGGEDLL
ncbi:MAG: multicomponent Na+:H+ antiporter subunit [Clostridia bacterium]|jgi:multicomponent Na+:H+ antiporter subunit B|nr:multicomponent Na+:H+ antiporter subunit [Clostridia bacterium]MDN5323808.1 multicomponent Na+:H+ antiporter subunit [Clostridia bacterium]